MSRPLFALVASGLLSAFLTSPSPAQITNSRITGVVTDASTAQPLAGAQVFVEGTNLGALTSENGRYFIVNVPPGTYVVVAQLIGYQTVRKENVGVTIDVTRTLNFEMAPQAVAVEEVRVEVERTVLIDVNARGSQNLISSDDLDALPVVSVEEALELQQGFFVVPDNENILAFTEKARGLSPIRIRGGRNAETVTLLDGIPIDNPVFGGSAFSLSTSAIEQIDFLKGGIPPKYGNALSGIINIATKEGGTELEGALEYQTSSFAGTLGSRADELEDFKFIQGFVSGPIPATANKLTFLFSARRQSGAERVLEFDDQVFDPSNPPTDLLNAPNVRDVFPGWSAFGFDNEQQIFGKVTYRLTPTTKLSLLAIDVERQVQRFDFDWMLTGRDLLKAPVVDSAEDSLFFANDPFQDVVLGSVRAKRTLVVGKFDQVFGRTIFNAAFGVFNQERTACNFFQGICLEDNFVDINFTGDQFVAPGVGASRVNSPTNGTDQFFGGEDITTYVVRGDFQSQVTDHHNIETGVFARFHDLVFDEKRNLGTNDVFTVNQIYKAEPWDAAAYLQDRIEYDFLNLDLGLRFDFSNAGGRFFVDPLDPNNGTTALEVCENPTAFGVPATDTFFVGGQDACIDPNVRDSAAILAAADDFVESKTRTQVSPRLGVSFPVTTTSSVFFNYSILSQQPIFQNIYQNTSIGTIGEARPCGLKGVPSDAIERGECGPIIFSDQFATSFLGNPNLEIERTTSYEIGFLSELGENYALSVILFNKDQFGLTGVRTGGGDQDIGATYKTSTPNYQVLVNEDFQTVRGIEVGLRKRLADYWALDINYSFSQARTNAAPPEREFQSRAEEFDPTIRREIRSDIDIPHVFNGTLRFAAGAEPPEVLVGGTDIGNALRHAGAVVTLSALSGIPYTPTTDFLGVGQGNQLERNSGRGPAIWSVDLRAQKGFSVGDLVYTAFLQVNNLLDRKNCFQPFQSTGRCDAGTVDQNRQRQGNLTGEGTTSTFFDRPHLFGPRRRISFGLRVAF